MPHNDFFVTTGVMCRECFLSNTAPRTVLTRTKMHAEHSLQWAQIYTLFTARKTRVGLAAGGKGAF
jgi:hypothetical protein